MKKFIYLLVITLIVLLSTQAQNKIIDSLEKLVTIQTDTSLAATYNELTWQYRIVDREKAIAYGNKAIVLATKLNYPKSVAQAYNDLGIIFYDKENFDTAVKLYGKAIEMRKQLKDELGMARLYLKIGILYQEKGVFDTAMENDFKSLDYFKNAKNDFGEATVLNNIGVLYKNMNKIDASIEFHKKALAIREKIKDETGIAMSYTNIASMYQIKKDYITAENFYKKSIKTLREVDNKTALASTLNNLGSLYRETEQYDKSIPFINEAMAIRIQLKDSKGTVSCYRNLGDIYLQKKEYSIADSIYKKALSIGEHAVNCLPEINDVYLNLSKLNEETGKQDGALLFYKKYATTKDSLYTDKLGNTFAQLETKYKTLEKDNQIQQQKFELSQKQYWIYGSLGLLSLITTLGFFYFKNYKLKNEKRLQEELLMQQTLNTKAIIDAEEKERKRIAGDLHDGIGQLFSTVKMNVEMLVEKYIPKQAEAMQLSEKTLAMVDESCAEVRSIAHQMMPNALIKAGLLSALRDFVNQIPNEKIKISIDTKGLENRLESNTETVLYRVIQESVNNVIKHANATELHITLLRDEQEVTASIEDNGKGFDTQNTKEIEGIGLKNMKTRIEYLKGSVEISSMPNTGTLISIFVPLT